jgi:glycosyltransferase involved in cell wall biosynthesis
VAGIEAPEGSGEVRLSVVLPALNAEATIEAQLAALERQRWDEPWEVVVADNGSTDRTREVVEAMRGRLPRLRIVDASASRGVAYARNRGVEAASGELLAFCDADDEVGDGWLAALGTALASHSFVGASQSVTKLNEPWLAKTWEALEPNGLRRFRFPPHFPYTGGACLAIRRELHDEIGGFDESLPACEDDDYCLRVQLAGQELVPVPEALVNVRLPSSSRALFRQGRWYAEGDALLQRKVRAIAGAPPRLWRWPLLYWRAIGATIPTLYSRTGRARLAWLLGFQLGRYRASIANRVLAI